MFGVGRGQMCCLFDVDHHGEDVVRDRAKSSVIANDIQLPVLQVGIQLRIVRRLQTISTLKYPELTDLLLISLLLEVR